MAPVPDIPVAGLPDELGSATVPTGEVAEADPVAPVLEPLDPVTCASGLEPGGGAVLTDPLSPLVGTVGLDAETLDAAMPG
jgi:hypothetical protein